MLLHSTMATAQDVGQEFSAEMKQALEKIQARSPLQSCMTGVEKVSD